MWVAMPYTVTLWIRGVEELYEAPSLMEGVIHIVHLKQ